MTLQTILLPFDERRVLLQAITLRTYRSELRLAELRGDARSIDRAVRSVLVDASLFHRGDAGRGPLDSAFAVGDASRTTGEKCQQE